MPFIANTSCQVQFTASAPAVSIVVPSFSWIPAGDTKVKATAPVLDESCVLMVPSCIFSDPTSTATGGIVNSVAPAQFKFTATAKKVKTAGGMVLCMGDIATASVNGTGGIQSGTSVSPYNPSYTVTATITVAGQTKVQAT